MGEPLNWIMGNMVMPVLASIGIAARWTFDVVAASSPLVAVAVWVVVAGLAVRWSVRRA